MPVTTLSKLRAIEKSVQALIEAEKSRPKAAPKKKRAPSAAAAITCPVRAKTKKK